MTQNVLFVGYDFNGSVSDYKYAAYMRESPNTIAKVYVSNNLRDLKSYVYNIVAVSYPTAKCDVYYTDDVYVGDPIYKCWREGNKTYSKTRKRR